jgi:branched-subunit amino acid aminotransferase/4-amino-4-deoxychorismate lyase
VLLTDNSGNIYEGMASNFFVIVNENGSPTLVTAGLEHVLLGTIMKIVLRVCEKRNIPVKWDFPRLQDAINGKWEGCFLSSTSRLVLPIETIQLKDGRYVTSGTSNLTKFSLTNNYTEGQIFHSHQFPKLLRLLDKMSTTNC